MKMKFLLLIVAIGVLTPCCWSWSQFTSDLMTSIPTDVESYMMYAEYLFPDFLSDCIATNDIVNMYPDLSPAAIDWIANTRLNYVPYCTELQTIVNQAKLNVGANLEQAVTEFTEVGDEIEWGYNLINTIFTNKGCSQEVIDGFMSTFQSNLMMSMQQAQYWSQTMGYMTEMIPSQAYYGFSQQIQMVLYDPSVTNQLKLVKLTEFQFIDETIRMYRDAAAYTEWYIESNNQGMLYGTKNNVERLVDGSVLDARAMVCV